jgi:peptidoglycan/xylan/chitin deacetylase (PgdA/CDA1 family)
MAAFNIRAGTVFEDFQDISSWAAGANAVKTADTTNFKTGTQGINLACDGGAVTTVQMTKTINQSFAEVGSCSIWCYFTEVINAQGINIVLSSDAGLVARMTYTLGTPRHPGWNKLTIAKSDWVASGGGDWSLTMIRMRITVNCVSGSTANVTFDDLKINVYDRPKVIVIFDDNYDSAYNLGFAYMDGKYAMPGVFATVSSYIDVGGRMTLAQLTNAHNRGWDVINHTRTHADLTALSTQAEMEAQIYDCTKYLYNNGFTRRNEHKIFAYPFSAYNDTAIAALRNQGMTCARGNFERCQANVLDNGYLLAGRANAFGVTLATAKAKVDLAVAEGATCILYFHILTAAPSVANDWLDTDFYALVDYIQGFRAGGVLDVITISEWFQGLTSNRKAA